MTVSYVLLAAVAMCLPFAQCTPNDLLLASVNQFCQSQGCGNISYPTRVAGPRGLPGPRGEPGYVDYDEINETISQMFEEKIENLTSRIEEISERSQQCCRQARQEIQEMQRKMVLISNGWREASNGFLYYFADTPITWQEANAECERRGAILASTGIRDPAIRRELVTYANGQKFWIGLSDRKKEGKWMWQDGHAASKRDPIWNVGEPNNTEGIEDCAHLLSVSGTWKANDDSCSTTTAACLCEKVI